MKANLANAVLRDEFHSRNEQVDKLLEDRRHDVIDLHAKIDDKVETLGQKVDGLRTEMGTKLDRIMEIMLGRLK